jgi:serine protease AprX
MEEIMKTFWSKAFSIVMLAIFLLGGLPSGFAAPSQAASASYIIQASSAVEAARMVEQAGGIITSRLDIINSVGAQLSPAALAVLQRTPTLTRITPNYPASGSDLVLEGPSKKTPSTDYPDVTGADMVWQQGVTGQGIGVAVLDTGIAPHPALLVDFKGRERKLVGWVDFIEKNKKNPHDPNGHGTHIAGVIANSQLGADNEYNGMAPAIDLVGVRVLDQTGQGSYETIIQGIQWVIQNKEKYHIRVINLSLQTNVQSPYWADPLNQAVTRAWAEGIVVVTVAGNNGPNPMTISVPGNNPYAITVGAFTDNYTPADWSDDYITPFSAAGPTLDGFAKPDLIAPGAHIVSTLSPGSYIARNHEANWVNGFYFSMAGTSQAAAVVTGTVALMLSHNPSLTPDQVKYRLMVTAMPWVKPDSSDVLYSIWQQGAGRLNAYDAVMSEDPQTRGEANDGMDILADLNGDQHYEGYSYYDEAAGLFRLHGTEDWTGSFGAWSGSFGAWSGSFGAWSGSFGAWSGSFGAWSGSFGAWSGSFGAWSGSFGAWSGGFGAWSGGFGAWSGGFGAWSGGFGAWSGSVPWAASELADPAFVNNFLNGVTPLATQKSASIKWADDPPMK